MKMAVQTHSMLKRKAVEGSYQQKSKDFMAFLNALSMVDMGCSSHGSDRITIPWGITYRYILEDEALRSLDETAEMYALPRNDPGLVLNNIYTGYLYPVAWPDVYSYLKDAGMPIPEEKSIIIKEFSVRAMYSLTLKACELTSKDINDLVGKSWIDNRPPTVIEASRQIELLGGKSVWVHESRFIQKQLGLRDITIDYLLTVANQFKIRGIRRDTPNALCSAVINAICEGYLT